MPSSIKLITIFDDAYECLVLDFPTPMRVWFALLLFCLPELVFAQSKIDSLRTVLPALKGVEKAEAYSLIIEQLVNSDLPAAKKLLEESRQFASAETDEAVRRNHLLAEGYFLGSSGAIDSGIFLLEECLKLAGEASDTTIMKRVSCGLGKLYISAGKPEKGLGRLFEALRLLDKQPDKALELRARVNIMWAYLELQRYRDCISFGKSSLREVTPEYEWIGLYLHNNMAASYGAMNMIDSARYHTLLAIDRAKQANNHQMVANGYFILGNTYAGSGEPAKAIEQYLLARPYREKVGNPSFIVSDLYTIADLYHSTGDYEKGVAAAREGLAVAEKFRLTLKMQGVYESLAKNYEGQGDHRNASKYYRLWAIAKDSVYKNATTEAIAEVQGRYESEKKEQRIALQNAELSEQKAEIRNTYIIIIGLAVIITLVIVIALQMRNRDRRKQKLLQVQNEVLLREAYIKATIQSQEDERKRFARDLHDSMGQLISSLRLILTSVDDKAPFEVKVDMVSRAERILDEMYREIRSVAFNLMPQTLIYEGLLPALNEMARRVTQTGKLIMNVRGFAFDRRLSELQEISLYRVVQEWTNNVIKYTDVSRIEVQLVAHDTEIILTIEDNGNGFDITTLEKSNGNGWKNIRSRLNLVKGMVDVDSKVGRRGTTLTVSVSTSVGEALVSDKVTAG
jgi:signal transduction histidine kinase